MSFEARSAFRAQALALPPDLAFLVWQGVSPDRLLRAAAQARRAGVDGATALLTSGLMAEEAYYRALARALGTPYLGPDLPLASDACHLSRLAAGTALLEPGAPASWVAAPRGPAIARLLRREDGPRPAITAPSVLHAALLRSSGEAAAREAAEGLERRAPAWAFRPGPDPAQWLALGLAFAAVPLVLGAPAWIQAGCLALLNLLFLAMTAFRLAAPCLRPAPLPEAARADEAALPVYTVLVALHREARVVPRLVRALARLDYPRAKLDVKFVIEADDPATAAALAAVPNPGWFEVIVAPPGLPRTKPRALNVALPFARGEHLVVYDAEDVPEPGQLRAAAALFAGSSPRTACLQGRLVIDNTADSWLTRCFTLEYAALFDVLVPALSAWRLPVPLGGTTTHFRTAALRALHGWDAWNVTEDADLGLRLALAGYHVGDLPLSTLEEAPARVGPWLRQRTRWMKGFVQTTITHSRRPRHALGQLGPLGLLAAAAMVPGTVLSALAYPVLIGMAGWRFLARPLPADTSLAANLLTGLALVLFLAGFAAMLLPAIVGCIRRRWWGLLPWVGLLPVYFLLVSAAAWLGLIELIRAPARWNKTEHGLAATSRSGRLT
ncbi:glycosyltransferase family 2 protein [Methylobacterium oryzisoli]|uniref:glycosyltransferase family 2 protein n=1 Tax=Methylobacterium oryzisoli TaxID=3385502 RepID=UPI003892338F